ATGTSSGALTYYLYLAGKLPDDKKCSFIQGEAMQRPSEIITELFENRQAMEKGSADNKTDCTCNDADIKIKVGGGGVILVKGEIE
ncbi:MAG: PhzF family phenazine biosynthesis protein, partial [Enterococcus sp.]|nr:PhzF family phenazine biosynthesis protein [Enterococcus sp.]